VKPDVMIEFRQPYVGPLIRSYGNMLRASDCPNSYLLNRVRTVDLRLLSGATAVHADMIMWHASEPAETAAFQLLNVLFAVPQVSVRLQDAPRDHLAMLRFYTRYWNENRGTLLDGAFEAPSPEANYPVVSARSSAAQIVGLYGDAVVTLAARGTPRIDVINAKSSTRVVLAVGQDLGPYGVSTRDCQGRVVATTATRLGKGVHEFVVPVSGILTLERGR
jgi:alpha-galactosidase